MTTTQQAEQIWLAYPKKLGNKKKAVESIKRSIKEIGFDDLLGRVERWVVETERRQRAPGFWPDTPYGSTFFNQERWRDEFQPMAIATPDPAPNMDGAISPDAHRQQMVREAREVLGSAATGMTDAQVWDRIPGLQRGKRSGA